MSTKNSITYDEEYHIYKELLDEDSVYLELENVDFTVINEHGYKSLTIRLPEYLAKKLNIIR